MDLAKIEHIIEKHLKKSEAQEYREKGYIYYHGKRVAEIAMKVYSIVKSESDSFDIDLLYIAGLIHDVGKGRNHHAVAGAKMIPKILGDELNNHEIKDIQRLVEEHNLREKPNECLVDSKCLQDADVLDHFGAQGVWLGIYYTARNHSNQGDMLEYFRSDEHREYVDEKYAGLNFDVSKKMFDERYEYQLDYVKRVSDM